VGLQPSMMTRLPSTFLFSGMINCGRQKMGSSTMRPVLPMRYLPRQAGGDRVPDTSCCVVPKKCGCATANVSVRVHQTCSHSLAHHTINY
jgi:hypothetical protein